MKLLIVEDEKRLAKALAHILKAEGYEVQSVYDGREGLLYGGSGAFDLMILDVMLPEMDGLSIVRALRKKRIQLPVLMLTARSEIEDRVTGLDAGADDYLTKPFAEAELVARVRALLRRGDQSVDDQIHRFDLQLSISSRILSCQTRQVELNNKEFQMMRLLMTNQDRYISKDEMLMRVWDMATEVSDNCVEAYISFLRKKLLYLKSGAAITTLRLVGYRLEEKRSC